MGDRCTGHCCRAFYLPWGPDRLKQQLKEIDEGRSFVTSTGPQSDAHAEFRQVAEMVIYIGFQKNPDNKDPNQQPGHYYTCKNYDGEKGQCKIYETRPNMCRNYPYASPCGYSSCTWDDGRAGTYPYHEYSEKMLEAARRCLKDPGDKRFDIFYLQSKKVISDGDMGIAIDKIKDDLAEELKEKK